MHEMSLAEAMIQLMEDNSRTQQYSKVHLVHLQIGRLSHVEAEAMRFCFEAVAEGTLAEGAELKISEVAGMGRCMGCEKSIEYQALYDPCPFCGDYRVQVTAGNEMLIKEMEVS